MTTTLTRAKPLLDYIAKHESAGDYNAVWGKIERRHRPPRKLTAMTVGEVLSWQDSIDPLYMSEAAGRYQFLEDTLRDIYGPAGVKLEDLFNDWAQDRLALHLLRRRGLKAYLRGEITPETFCTNLAHEWASLPYVTGSKKGQSAYGGDGLNKAHADPDEFLRVVCDLTGAPPARPSPFAAILRAILGVFGRK